MNNFLGTSIRRGRIDIRLRKPLTGRDIVFLLEKHGHQLSDIATEVGLSANYVSYVVHGKYRCPRISDHVANLLGLPSETLWPDKSEPALSLIGRAAEAVKALLPAGMRRPPSKTTVRDLEPEEIKEALASRGLSQRAIATSVGVTSTLVHNFIHGRNKSPRVQRAIANALDLSPAEIWPSRYPADGGTRNERSHQQ